MGKLDEILIRDKFVGLEQVAQILKEEISPIASEFFVLEKEPAVRFMRVRDHYVFNVEIDASRIKPFGHHM